MVGTFFELEILISMVHCCAVFHLMLQLPCDFLTCFLFLFYSFWKLWSCRSYNNLLWRKKCQDWQGIRLTTQRCPSSWERTSEWTKISRTRDCGWSQFYAKGQRSWRSVPFVHSCSSHIHQRHETRGTHRMSKKLSYSKLKHVKTQIAMHINI